MKFVERVYASSGIMNSRRQRSNLISTDIDGVLRFIRYNKWIIVFLASLVLNSCNRRIPDNTLRFWHFWSEPGQKAVMDSVIDDFRREHPDITVEVSELSWSDGKTKLMINFNAQTAPDVLELGSDWVAQFSSSGVLADLSNVSGLRSAFAVVPEYAIPCGMWDGKYYAVPWFVDTRVLYLNHDLIVEALDSSRDLHLLQLNDWRDLFTIAQAIQTKGTGKGFGVNGSDMHRLYKKILPQIWSNGGDILDAKGKPTFSTPENIEALTLYVDQLKYGMLDLQKNLDDAFKRGKLGILFSGSWLVRGLKDAPFRWYTAEFPGMNGHRGISFAGGEYLAVNNASKMKKHAVELIAFLTRRDNELRLAKAFNIFPADTLLQQDSFYLNRPQGDVFSRQLRSAKMTPVHPKWLEIEAVLEDETAQALYKKKTPAEALRDCDKRVTEIINEP
jgi:multiple sugar transport system substrate-binding protein